MLGPCTTMCICRDIVQHAVTFVANVRCCEVRMSDLGSL
jgi:hypothetical protein